MSDITLSAGVRGNLQSLQNISNLLTTSQGRLATGKKVNSALDDPTSFFTARNLNDRSGKLTKLIDGINGGISTIKAASTGLDSIYKALQTAQGIIDSVKADVAKASNQVAGVPPATPITGATVLGTLGFANNNVLTFLDNVTGSTTTVALGATAATDTVQDLVNKINTQGAGVYSASVAGGKVTLTSTSSNGFTVSNTPAQAAAITGATGLLGGASGTSVVGVVDQNKINSYAKQFNDILASIDQFAGDSGFNGVNLLKAGNDLNILYNEEGTSKTTVTSRDVNSTNFSLTNVNAAGTGTVSNFTGQETTLKNALASVRTYQAEYATHLATAQNRQDFARSVINILKTGADNLTNADQNEEAANVLALQTRQQLSQSALSLAVQSDQAVLQLLK